MSQESTPHILRQLPSQLISAIITAILFTLILNAFSMFPGNDVAAIFFTFTVVGLITAGLPAAVLIQWLKDRNRRKPGEIVTLLMYLAAGALFGLILVGLFRTPEQIVFFLSLSTGCAGLFYLIDRLINLLKSKF
ncbi:hypothetical protein [Jeotgalibacillus terrae]|uniref:Permease n=1 Tax=Jeotgalibacillus terrae TaxID=587735 RepID=A0ABW5ZJR0_9BACL|nr:hypothetical protein [Jeotgalibacillus terrae]MBM7578676.1 uncharacterized membrane protein YhaH (DUF805 family) [Jeotgalibacillus terrae]